MDSGKVAADGEAKGSSAVESCAVETNGTDVALAGVGALETQSLAIKGNGLLANGVTGWSELEKLKAGGCDDGLSSNQTSLYI